MPYGFGSQPFGSSPYGIGTPSVATPRGGTLFRSTSGARANARRINPATKDYVLDGNGRILGMPALHQRVLLAVSTERGSSAMRSLGQSLKSIQRISDNFARRVEDDLRTAVKHLTDPRLIEVVDVQISIVKPGGAFIRFRWRDLSTGELVNTPIGGQEAINLLPPVEGVAAPSITDLTLDGVSGAVEAEAVGGEELVITGLNLEDASVEWAGVPCVVTSESATQLTIAALPAVSSGAADIVVTTPGGSDDAPLEALAALLDPATLALAGWWRGDYSASPWAGVASAGGSGAQNLTEATNPPGAGSAVNGFVPADFDGANDKLSGAAVSTFHSTTAFSGWALIYLDAVNTDSGVLTSNDALLCTAGTGQFWIYLRNNAGAVTVHITYFDAAVNPMVSTSISLGAWQFVQWRRNTTIMEIRVNGGAWASVGAVNAVNSLAASLDVGRNVNADNFLDGRMLDLGMASSRFDDDTFDDLRAYVNDRYGLSV
jgi:hypothetical protein